MTQQLNLALSVLIHAISDSIAADKNRCTLETLTAARGTLSPTEFQPYKNTRAVVLKNLTSSWNHSAWNSVEVFLDTFGNLRANLLAYVAYNRTNLGHGETFIPPTLREYMTSNATKHHIQFEFNNHIVYRKMRSHYKPIPAALLQAHQVPLISLGRKRTGSGGHAHEENWLAQLAGRKMWIVAPPKSSAQQWPSFTEHPCDIIKSKHSLPKGAHICVVHPSETLYLPSMWYHATCNLDEFTFGVGGKGNSDHWPRHLFYIQAGSEKAIRDAVAKGVNVRQGGGPPDNMRPLHLAAKVGPPGVLDVLIESRADPYVYDNDGSQVVHKAAEQGPVSVLEHLIKKRIATVDDREKDTRFQPLHSAAFSGRWSSVDWLLKNGALINSREGSGATALHLAAAGGHAEFVRRLLERRSDLNAKDKYGRDSLCWAAGNDKLRTMQTLQKRGIALSRLHLENAVQHGRTYAAEWLLQMRVSPNERQPQSGATVLHLAAKKGHLPVAKVLVRYKADLDEKDKAGKSAVDLSRKLSILRTEL